MFSLTCFNLRFTPNWRMCLLALGFFSFLIGLGLWQLQRADEKKLLLAEHAKLSINQAHWMPNNGRLPDQYEKIRVKGRFLSTVFLLDNQHYDHQFGYDVLSPLQLSNGQVILVDRGWIPGDQSRRVFPKIEVPQGVIELQGQVYFPSDKQWVLGPTIEKKQKDLIVIERIETKLLSHILQKKFYPYIIRLHKKEQYGFIREWVIVSMPPERHIAYAIQWFVMAGVIFILFIALNTKKNNGN